MIDGLLSAWEHALPSVLALMDERQRGMFRQELQRFLALAGFDPPSASRMEEPLQDLLLGAARAARRPAAIATLRDRSPDSGLVLLCEHLLACWRDAEALAADEASTPPDDESGIFFGPRLGGAGRHGAARRDEPEER